MNIPYPTLKPTLDNKYIVVEDYVYKDIRVPNGYLTNGANIPRSLWLFVPPFKPKYMNAVVVHDYLCDLEMYEKADKYFEEILSNVEKTVVTKFMILAVKQYHKFRYNTK